MFGERDTTGHGQRWWRYNCDKSTQQTEDVLDQSKEDIYKEMEQQDTPKMKDVW